VYTSLTYLITMQVEYEDTPTMFSTSEVLPPQALSEPQGSEDEDQEQDVDDVEEEEEDDEEEEQLGTLVLPLSVPSATSDGSEGTESGLNPEVKTKAKRIIKQRQSLSEKQPGTTIFPISRVKKICKADKELDMMTNEATFMVSVATVSSQSPRIRVTKLMS
jgi:DNA polymerase epsilon subunit 4